MSSRSLAGAPVAASAECSFTTGAVFDVLEAALAPLGFTVERFIDGIEPDGPVENLLAVRAGSGPVHQGETERHARGPDAPAGARVRVTGSDGAVLLVEAMD